MHRFTFAILLLLSLALSACGPSGEVQSGDAPTNAAAPAEDGAASPSVDAPSSIEIRLPMGYIPDPQYAPFYVAVEKGYFADEGIDITFDYSFETDGMALVGAGEVPLAVVSGEQVLLARAQALPVVYIFEWFQRYPIAIISKSSSEINAPEDLIDRSVGLPGFFGASYVGYVGLLASNGIAQEEVQAEDISFTQVESLLTDRVEAVVGYANNEPVQLAAQGEEVEIIYVADYIDMVANGIVTNEQTIAENPELIQGFVRAFLRGLQETLADPAAAFAISKGFVEGLEDDRMGVLEASLPMWETETPGITDPVSWEQTEAILLQMGLLDAPLEDLEKSYTNRFVLEAQSELE